MPYDKRWDRTETKPDVFSLEGLVGWLEKQPAETAYEWFRPEGCLVCKYLQAVTGAEQPWYMPQYPDKQYHEVFPTHDLYLMVGGSRPWIFGAALTRARAALNAEDRETAPDGIRLLKEK